VLFSSLCKLLTITTILHLVVFYKPATDTNSLILHSVGVTTVDRPAAAPQTGPFDLGVVAVGHPGFIAGLVAALNLFCRCPDSHDLLS
jgi:hypothetical protein